MIYIAVIEHPLNDFDAMDPKIFDGIIKPKVIDQIKNEIQMSFGEVEQSFQIVQDLLIQMKQSSQDEVLTEELMQEAEPVLETINQKTRAIDKKLDSIKKTWFESA